MICHFNGGQRNIKGEVMAMSTLGKVIRRSRGTNSQYVVGGGGGVGG